jgi:glycosyltransferase involved in cell wall biosynthesis
VLSGETFEIVVGVNGSTDRTAEIARGLGAGVGVTGDRGYGHGCQAAIDALCATGSEVDAYVFFAADGANDPRDIVTLIRAFEAGEDMVLGSRVRRMANWRTMNLHYVAVNLLLGLWVGVLTGRAFTDLGPLRVIRRELFDAMALREWTFGWTIEAQVRAVRLGARIAELPVRERERVAGEQKVSRVSPLHSARIGLQIIRAGWRTRFSRRREAAWTRFGAGAGAVLPTDLPPPERNR